MCHSKLSAEPESKWTRRVRPFSVDIPEEKLDDLRRRIVATRWPSEELVDDRSQGVQLAMLRELACYSGRSTASGRSRRVRRRPKLRHLRPAAHGVQRHDRLGRLLHEYSLAA